MSTTNQTTSNPSNPSTPHNITPVTTKNEDTRSASASSLEDVDSLCDTDSESICSSTSSTHIEEFKGIGTWGTYGIDPKAFCDKFRPVVRDFKDLELNPEDLNGFLTDKIIASGSSYLEKCPLIQKYVLCKAVLSGKKLKYIGALKFHHYLQYLDLSYNELTEIQVLSHLPYLIHLDVSHNELLDLLGLDPPFNLSFVNYSHNSLMRMKDISNFWSLKSLNLSHNQIEKIYGLQELKYLETLDVSHNLLTRIENLDKLNIITLNLSHNRISSFVCDSNRGFKTMPLLSYVSLSNNDLNSLEILENSAFLQSLNFQNNNIVNLLELSHLQCLEFLISVNLNGNPVVNNASYETVCIDTIKNLKYLDGNRIEVEKKIIAKPSFNLETKMTAGQHSGWSLVLSHLTALPCLGSDVLPKDIPPRPLIVVVGPIGSEIPRLLNQFSRAHSHSVTRLILHTDRDMSAREIPSDFHFIYAKQFQEMLENGEFSVVFDILNDNYGLSHEEFSKKIQETGKVMVLWSDLSTALELRLRGMQPYILLAFPKSEKTHREWITEAYETQVYNIQYPEAAINILNRESTIYSQTSSRSSTENPFECITEHINEMSSEHESMYGEDDYSDDVQKIHRKLIGIGHFCWNYQKTPLAHDLPENFGEFSCEGSTIILPEDLVKYFYTKVLQSRETYLDFHRENPGVFYEIIYTDQTEKAMELLKSVCKKALRVQREQIFVETVDNNSLCQSFIENRLKMFEDDIEKAMVRNVRCDK